MRQSYFYFTPAIDGRVRAALEEQLAEALKTPGLRPHMMHRRDLLPRFAGYYQHLCTQPRRARRALQRQWKRSLAAIALLLALGQAPALAATINVNTVTPDINATDGLCSLIEAIVNANDDAQTYAPCVAGSGPDRIVLPAGSTHTLTVINNQNGTDVNGLPKIKTVITIEGNNSTILRATGAPAFRIFSVDTNYGQTVAHLTLDKITVSGGGGSIQGGGINSNGTVTLTNSIVSGNSGSGAGGIQNSGTLTLTNSVVSDNSAGYVGGVQNNGILIMEESTISGNFSNGSSGGLENQATATLKNSTVSGNASNTRCGGLNNSGTMTITNSTISGNSVGGPFPQFGFGGGLCHTGVLNGTLTVSNSTISGNTTGGRGGGVHFEYGDLTLVRTLISGNTASTGREIARYRGQEVITADNYNLFGHSGLSNAQAFSGFTPGASDLTATSDGTVPTALSGILDPLLFDNGGPTKTHALASGSPAIDASPPDADCQPADQRGVSRPQGPACDIGAFEMALEGLDLSVAKTDSPDPVTETEELTYTVTVNNSGPSDATDVTLTDTLPSGVTFESATPPCGEAGGIVTCNLGALANGANATVEIVVRPTAPGRIANTVAVTANETDLNQADNTDAEDTDVVAASDLLVVKTDSPDPVVVSDHLTYRATVTNNGPSDATGVTLRDTLPPSGVTFVSASSGCSLDVGIVTCNLGTLANGGNATVEIIVRPTAVGEIVNTVEVTGNEADPNTANNTKSERTTVNPLLCDGLTPTIVGTPGNDTILGTTGLDRIHGLGGDDVIRGGNGGDVICGGEGNDTLNGDNGGDRLFGENGNDTLNGNNGRDFCDGGSGTSTVNCETGPGGGAREEK